jgi:hypothetical protein
MKWVAVLPLPNPSTIPERTLFNANSAACFFKFTAKLGKSIILMQALFYPAVRLLREGCCVFVSNLVHMIYSYRMEGCKVRTPKFTLLGFLALFLMILVAACEPIQPLAPAESNLTGAWQSPEGGLMALTQQGDRVQGRYEHDQGQLEGTLNGGRLSFRWWERVEAGGPYEKAAPQERGEGYFDLSTDGSALFGQWRLESSTDWDGNWTAVRVGSAPITTPGGLAPVVPTSQPPAALWQDLPVYPGAEFQPPSSEENSSSYIAPAIPEQVRVFYEEELGKLGWNLIKADPGAVPGSTQLTFFRSNRPEVTLLIIPLEGNSTEVRLYP